MVGWHHRLNKHELEKALGVCDGQGSLASCSPWGRRVGHNWEAELSYQGYQENWTTTTTIIWQRTHSCDEGKPRSKSSFLLGKILLHGNRINLKCSRHIKCTTVTTSCIWYALYWASQVALMIKNLPASAKDMKDKGSILGWEDPLEEVIATHSSIHAWRIPSSEESGRLWLIGLWRLRHEWSMLTMHMCFVL